MDIKHSLALKKKRELLGTTNKRKMSLRNNIDCLKQNECRLDITQITKCVFLGSLCLKPVPQLFDSPLLLEELDTKVGNVKEAVINNENINGLTNLNNFKEKDSGKKLAKQSLNMPKMKKKSLREKNEIKTESNGISKIIKSESISGDSNECIRVNGSKAVYTSSDVSTEIIDDVTENSAEKRTIMGGFRTPAISSDATTVSSTAIILTSMEMPANEKIISSFEEEEEEEEDSDGLEIPDLKLFIENINGQRDATEELPTQEMKPANTIPLDYEELERLKREPTPEIILSDSDEDAIDQLMYNIMDIKVGTTDFGKDLFELSSSDSEQYNNNVNDKEYSRTETRIENENNNATEKEKVLPKENLFKMKKYIKRNPQCKICSKIFNTYSQLKKHKASHDGEKPYVCLKCNENHPSLDQLLAHLRTHQGKRPYICKKCGEGFKTLKALENHQPVHVLKKTVPEKKQYQCEVCSKQFRKLCDLERHTRVHTGEKPAVCNICNKRFQQAHNLNKHLLIHTKVKSFECDICHKKFGRNDVLNRHLLTHSVKKPHQCEICMKSFIRASQLMAHKEKSHPKS